MFCLKRAHFEALVQHALREAPNECCGLIAGVSGGIAHIYPTANPEASPVRYSMEPKELLRCLREMEEQGWELLGIYHSHTHSEAYPSATDIRLAFWPDSLYFIISLKDPGQPTLRAFYIRDGKVSPEPVEIV